LREGLVVAIAGPPNAGKSTLLNRLARREAAIVSPYAGTTRDVIEVHLDLGGYPVTLLDTAGIRPTDDPVELEGVRRAQARAAEADLVLWLSDAREPAADRVAGARDPEKRGAVSRLREARFGGRRKVGAGHAPIGKDQVVWLVQTKADLASVSGEQSFTGTESNLSSTVNDLLPNLVRASLTIRPEALTDVRNESVSGSMAKTESATSAPARSFRLSAVTGEGIEPLMAALAHEAAAQLDSGESVLITRARHRDALEETLAALRRVIAEPGRGEDLIAEDLRLAAAALGRLTGRIDVEDVLDVIFRDFCIGK
jgi:tRNA modification GTPase